MERRIAMGAQLYFTRMSTFSDKEAARCQVSHVGEISGAGAVRENRKMLHTLSEDMVKKYGMSYIRILWVADLSILMQYYEPEIRGAIDADMLLKSYYG
ncbi:MAG: hypothetical protein ACLTAF_13755 [Blautia coccoides]